LLTTVLIIVFGKSLGAFVIVRAFGHPMGTAFAISASLAQIGEFAFILAGLGVGLGLLPPQGRDLVLAGAVISIMLNPFCFALLNRLNPWLARRAGAQPESAAQPIRPAASTAVDHAVLVGHGRVGSVIAEAWGAQGRSVVVIEQNEEIVAGLRSAGIEAFAAEGPPEVLLKAANVAAARVLFVAIPNGFEAGQFVEQGRAVRPELVIVARAHSDAEVEHLRRLGADETVMGEREIGVAMSARAAARTSSGSV
jgi:CPA2 family monovalent cation:H+ antiporter-2